MTAPPKKQIVSMFLQPILDPFSKTYYDVITLSNKPKGPLSHFVKQFSFPKLSEFQSNDLRNQCIYVVLNSFDSNTNTNSNKYAGIDEISDIFSFLISNGYIIEEELTRITSQFNNNRRLVCMFSYTE